MSDEQHREPESLPLWVEDLMSKAEERGYGRGFEDGQKQLWYQMRDRIEGVRPYGA